MEKLEFAFRREKSGILGTITRPVARVILINHRIKVPEILYVDSGADITMIPKSIGDLLGLRINTSDKIDSLQGIGERSVAMVVKRIKMQIGDTIIPVRIAWALTEGVPLLLGRSDIFKLFNITFVRNEKTVFIG